MQGETPLGTGPGGSVSVADVHKRLELDVVRRVKISGRVLANLVERATARGAIVEFGDPDGEGCYSPTIRSTMAPALEQIPPDVLDRIRRALFDEESPAPWIQRSFEALAQAQAHAAAAEELATDVGAFLASRDAYFTAVAGDIGGADLRALGHAADAAEVALRTTMKKRAAS